MENKKIDVRFGIVVIAFLVCVLILARDIKTMRNNDYKEYTASLAEIIKVKNAKIKALALKNADLQNTLTDTRNALDALTKKLTASAAK